MRRTMKFLAVVAAAAAPALAGAQTIRVAGFGQGCFYLIGSTPCTNFATNAMSSSVLTGSGLRYTGGSLSSYTFDHFSSDGFIGIGGSPDNFGMLSTDNATFNYGTSAPKLGFRLLVALAQPSGVVGMHAVDAVITGSTSTRAGGSGGVFYNFDNSLQGPFEFFASEAPGAHAGDPNVAGGSGSLLSYGVNDLSVLNRQTASITGNISLEVTTPEPASVALTATGLLALGGAGIARRRKS